MNNDMFKNKKSPIRWVVIGVGHIGKRHCEEIIKNDLIELVALCDIKSPKDLNLNSNLLAFPFFRSVDNLLKSDIKFDVASICTPNGTHFELSCLILDFKKIAVIEKPIVLDAKQRDKLFEKSDNGKRIYGVLQNRYNPVSIWLKNLIDCNKLGAVYRVDMQCLWNRNIDYYTDSSWHGDEFLDSGTLFTQYSHFVDILIWMFGDMHINSANFWNYNHIGLISFEDSGMVEFKTDNNIDGTLIYSTSTYKKNMGIFLTVIAEKGCIKLSGPFMNVIDYYCIENVDEINIPDIGTYNIYGSYSGSAKYHDIVIDNIAKDIIGLPANVTKLDDCIKVVKVINDIYEFKKNENHKK